MSPASPAFQLAVPAGTYIVGLNQPQRILAKAILEPDTPQDKAFIADNIGEVQPEPDERDRNVKRRLWVLRHNLLVAAVGIWSGCVLDRGH